MYKSGTHTEIASGSNVLQSTVIRVVITVNEGYDLEKFTVNGKPVELSDTGSGDGSKAYSINGVSGEHHVISQI